LSDALRVLSPFLHHRLHIGWQFRIKIQFFRCGRVSESEGFGMQCLTGTERKAIFHKLFVAGEDGAFGDSFTSVKIIIE
jgi:hypothetical protein